MKNESKRSFIHLLEVALVAAALLLVVLGAEDSIEVKDAAMEAEVKANLHDIQLSIERFAVDSQGAYPQHLIGGEARYAARVSATDTFGGCFRDISELDPIERASDPLLREGYTDAYPRNPFVRSGLAIHQLQEDFPFAAGFFDPLRNGSDQMGAYMGTRFGAECNAMGSVLADPRFSSWINVAASGMVIEESTYANIEYPFWDVWADGDKPQLFLPGMFFYKCAGAMDLGAGNLGTKRPLAPTVVDQYIMGGYGSIRTEGKDIMGAEQPIIMQTLMLGDDGAGGELEIWHWTRSAMSYYHPQLDGSPYSPHQGDGHSQLDYGNPNGIRDGIILVLTAGEVYRGK